MAKTKPGDSNQITTDLRTAINWLGQSLNDLKKRFICTKIFFALIAGQFKRNNRHRQTHGFRHSTRIILDQFGRTRGTNNQGLGLKTVISILTGCFKQIGRISAQIARLKGGIGHRWAVITALDHCEQQIGISIALRGMQHVMQALHPCSNAHRANMGRAFICPNRQLHSAASRRKMARRRSGRENKPAKSPACS